MEIKKLLHMNEAMWDAIQDWRFEHRCENASEAMRKLIALGLETRHHQGNSHTREIRELVESSVLRNARLAHE